MPKCDFFLDIVLSEIYGFTYTDLWFKKKKKWLPYSLKKKKSGNSQFDNKYMDYKKVR